LLSAQVLFEIVVDQLDRIDVWHVRRLIGDVQSSRHRAESLRHHSAPVDRRIVHHQIERRSLWHAGSVGRTQHCRRHVTPQKVAEIVASRSTATTDENAMRQHTRRSTAANCDDHRMIASFCVRFAARLGNCCFATWCIAVRPVQCRCRLQPVSSTKNSCSTRFRFFLFLLFFRRHFFWSASSSDVPTVSSAALSKCSATNARRRSRFASLSESNGDGLPSRLRDRPHSLCTKRHIVDTATSMPKRCRNRRHCSAPYTIEARCSTCRAGTLCARDLCQSCVAVRRPVAVCRSTPRRATRASARRANEHRHYKVGVVEFVFELISSR